MSRQRLTGTDSDVSKTKLNFKQFKGSKGLFGTTMSKLPKRDQSYIHVSKQIQNLRLGKDFEEISLKDIAYFFIVQFEYIFEQSCLDHNWFNFQNTIKRIQDYEHFENNVQLANFLYESIQISYGKIYTDIPCPLTLSTFKRAWLLDMLLGKNKPKFSGFY